MKRLLLVLAFAPTILFGGVLITPNSGISNPNSSNVTFSDPTKTFLLGAASAPDISGLVAPSDVQGTLTNGAQLLINTHNSNPGPADSKAPLMIVGDYRSGSSGDRYYMAFTRDAGFETNASVKLDGATPNIIDSYMLRTTLDVSTGIEIQAPSTSFTEASGGKALYIAGRADKDSAYSASTILGTQGTIRLYNVYGQTTVTYAYPQLILGDIGTNSSAPAWTYGSLRQAAGGHTYLGTYNNGTNAQGNQIDVTSAGVAVTGTLSASGHTTFEGVTSTGATGTGKLVFDGTPTLVTPNLGVASATSLKITGGNAIYPSADSTTAIYFNKADNATHMGFIDSTNSRFYFGTTTDGLECGDANGANRAVLMDSGNRAALLFYKGFLTTSTGGLSWGFGSGANEGEQDTGIFRSAAGVAEMNNGTVGTYRDLKVRALRANAVTFANAVTSPPEGTIQAFTDSSTATWGATITGSGSNHVLGYYDGTNWTVMAK